MKRLFVYIGVFTIGEIVALLLFLILRSAMTPDVVSFKKPDIETFKGILERFMLLSGLLGGYSTVLVMFGALKLGTRLHDENDKSVSNNYFLLGNFLSALIAIADAIIYGEFIKM